MNSLTDAELERRIYAAELTLRYAKTPQDQRRAFERLRELIAQRSAEQVRRMERERGLAR